MTIQEIKLLARELAPLVAEEMILAQQANMTSENIRKRAQAKLAAAINKKELRRQQK